MRIGLFGFTFSHENMGCQALTCAFLEMLQRKFIDEEIEVVNFFDEHTLGYIPNFFPEMRFKIYRISLRDFGLDFHKELKKCDIIFDETFGDGFSDIYFVKSVYRNILIKIMCGRSKKPFILTPQTYGPFQHKILEWLAGYAIKKADLVYARDMISADYATKISNRYVKSVTDLAFALPYEKTKQNEEKIKIGINVSGLLWQGGFGNNKNQFGLLTDYRRYCKSIVEYGLNRGMSVHVIPHVTESADEGRLIPDGDYPACKELVNEYEAVELAPCFQNPYEAKNYIANMNYFVGARMHSTIGAFSAGVITIPFAYSRKFKGLFENIGYPFLIDGIKLDTLKALQLTIDYIEHPQALIDAQEKAMKNVKRNMELFENELIKILKERVGTRILKH